jgi:hypothetical protein
MDGPRTSTYLRAAALTLSLTPLACGAGGPSDVPGDIYGQVRGGTRSQHGAYVLQVGIEQARSQDPALAAGKSATVVVTQGLRPTLDACLTGPDGKPPVITCTIDATVQTPPATDEQGKAFYHATIATVTVPQPPSAETCVDALKGKARGLYKEGTGLLDGLFGKKKE